MGAAAKLASLCVTAGEYSVLLLYRKLDFFHEECQIDS